MLKPIRRRKCKTTIGRLESVLKLFSDRRRFTRRRYFRTTKAGQVSCCTSGALRLIEGPSVFDALSDQIHTELGYNPGIAQYNDRFGLVRVRKLLSKTIAHLKQEAKANG